MDYATLIYLASTLGNISAVLSISSIIILMVSGIAIGATWIFSREYNEDSNYVGKQIKGVKNMCFAAFATLLVSCFIPGERVIYMMVGASIVQDVVEDPRTAGITDRIVRLIEQKLDETLQKEPIPEPVVETPPQ